MSSLPSCGPTAELARILVMAAMSDSDSDSVESLSVVAGLSRRVLQRRCQTTGVTAHGCVHFVQCLKLLLTNLDCDPSVLAPWTDPRTVRRILTLGGFPQAARPHLLDFLRTQQFIRQRVLLDAILEELRHLEHNESPLNLDTRQ
jgi:hypothetical protein